jgi:hypothetical protein
LRFNNWPCSKIKLQTVTRVGVSQCSTSHTNLHTWPVTNKEKWKMLLRLCPHYLKNNCVRYKWSTLYFGQTVVAHVYCLSLSFATPW